MFLNRVLVLALALVLGACLHRQEREPELCNLVDDDNDPMTSDGTGEPSFGKRCDGSDSDFCPDGVLACTDGQMACVDAGEENVEVCDQVDNDCNGEVDEGIDFATDITNCGGCGLECRNANGTTACTGGTCAPVCTAGSEDCNDNQDDGCEVFRDRNPTCTQVVSMGAVPGDVQPSSIEYVGSDESYVVAVVTEISSATVDSTALVELQSPPGVNFDLFVRCASCAGALVGQSTLGAGMTDAVQFRTTDFNGNNDRALFIEVRYISANACAPLWRLKVTGGAVVSVSPNC